MRRKRPTPHLSAPLLQQLAAATRQGLPLAEVAAILASDPETVPAGAPASFAAALATGQSLSATLAQMPSVAAPSTAAWMSLAEKHQQLPAALQAWGDDVAQVDRGQRARRLALLWPSAVAVTVLILWAVLAVFVIPAFAQTFDSFGANLPAPTILLFTSSQLLIQWWWLVAIAVAGCVWAVWQRKLPVPLVRAAHRLTDALGFIARWRAALFGHRLVALLSAHPDSGPLQAAAMAHLSASTSHAAWAATAQRLQAGLLAGQSLSAVLQSEAALPRRLAAFVQLGERTGRPEAALATLAETAADELQEAQARFERGTVLLLYQLLGLTVGALVLAVYLPIFGMGALV
jgi:type IV pilus assembly protein PilC